MGVVTTSMHLPRNPRLIRNIILLLNRQSIHISSQRDRFTSISNVRYYPSSSSFYLVAPFPQMLLNYLRRPFLLKAKFWMHVKVSSPGYYLVLYFLSFLKRIEVHGLHQHLFILEPLSLF
ncbi:119aa long hypothetical protein [Pyrococcus horikoshii OT3]|uniref:Uncharacterized protein n=1 Tax=Pyrococcus horikoshii (strain ATCC 700860 / DSM 12428 / JCM 9974 / NBRC 100139 / OT-3) TaxID=70601 RepID=O58454_PYRHO|nr:119aa long hypothetical protein [Pyrococcus horikoshii OT3]